MTDTTGNDFDAERTQRFDFQMNPQTPAAQPNSQPFESQPAQPAQPVQAPAFDDLLMPAADNSQTSAGFREFQESPSAPVTVVSDDAIALKKKRPIGLIVTLCVFVALLAAMIGGFFGARAYFGDRVAPGVSFGGMSLTGQSADQVRAVVESKIADSKVAITSTDGKSTNASLEDLGVNADVDATVNALINAKPGTDFAADFSRLNPWAKQDVPLTVTTDKQALSNYLTEQLVDESKRSVPASVSYNSESKHYDAVDGREGQTPDPKPVEQAVAAVAAEPGTTQQAKVDYLSVSMPITLDTAQKAADEGNQRLGLKLVVNNGAKKSVTVPAEEIAKWIGFNSDPDASTITVTYNDNAVKDYLSSVLPDQLKQDMVKASVVTNKAGEKMMTVREGVDGVTVTNIDDAVTQVVDGLKSGNNVTATVNTEVTKFETESRVVDYDSPNGDPYMVVNLSEQKAYGYMGSTLVKTFNISSGKPSTPSDVGTFFVYIKYEAKTMRGGSGADAYVSPNVPYATFYNGGEAFHAAKWNPDGIAMGQPRSHGCINMNLGDAKWVYDNMPVGAMVQVVGSTPAPLDPSNSNSYGVPVRG